MRRLRCFTLCLNFTFCLLIVASIYNVLNVMLPDSTSFNAPTPRPEITKEVRKLRERVVNPIYTKLRAVHHVDCSKIVEGEGEEIKKAHQIMQKKKISSRDDADFLNLTKDCTRFRRAEGYGRSPVSQEELDFPIAYSILMYKDVDQTARLLRTLYRKHNVYCIHVDASAPGVVHEAVSKITGCLENVFIVTKREDVIYEGISRLQADLNCMSDLLKHDVKWKYFINLPSQQFPLKTNLEIVKILKIYNGANDIEGISLRGRMLSSRYQYVHKLNGTRIVKTSEKKTKPPHNITVVKGSAYGIFSRDFVDFILNDKRSKDLLDWSRDVRSPDEYFWATLNHNKVLDAPGSYSGVPDKKPWLAVYAAWGGRDRCHGKFVRGVCIFGVGDLAELVSRKELFANKFYDNYQPITLQCLEEWLHNKSITSLPFETFYYLQLPFIRKK